MKKNMFCSLVITAAILFASTHIIAGDSLDPTYSEIDGVFYSHPLTDCDELKNAEECETFKANELFSLRDNLAYSDCTVECDDLFESDACYSYRDTYPCSEEREPLVASFEV